SREPANVALAFVVLVVAGSLFNTEDLAWRGLALPLLQKRYSALVASLLIGVPEGLTHLPGFFAPGDFRQQVGIFWFMAFTIAIVKAMKDRKSTRLNSSHLVISYAVFCLKKKKTIHYYLIFITS